MLHCRDALQLVVHYTSQLVDYLKEAGPEEAQNIDKLLLRESMDVIGMHSPPCAPAQNKIPGRGFLTHCA